jgi:hypothetical protein
MACFDGVNCSLSLVARHIFFLFVAVEVTPVMLRVSWSASSMHTLAAVRGVRTIT